jgi:hypothetical protein
MYSSIKYRHIIANYVSREEREIFQKSVSYENVPRLDFPRPKRLK